MIQHRNNSAPGFTVHGVGVETVLSDVEIERGECDVSEVGESISNCRRGNLETLSAVVRIFKNIHGDHAAFLSS